VGDGNFHVGYLIDPTTTPSARAPSSSTARSSRALALGGTCSGEHGVGLHKMGFLLDEAGAGAVDLMRTIKRALDPLDIMNPGKVFGV
jgi:D-lactate dehydrogenase (cytochrome)